MKIAKLFMLLAGAAIVNGLNEKQEQTVTDLIAILKRGTSIYPLEDLLHQLAVVMEFKKSAARLSRFIPGSKAAYATVYDMLIYVDTNGKHTTEQHEKLRELTDIIGAKVLQLNSKEPSFKTVVLQEEEANDDDDATSTTQSSTRHII
ncbi:hypothetical protein IWW57_005962 [Coemansia sp. S610]|uniref:Uncharacterized protein n=1 Tax=Coemansia linderi TaxID=2663919 RepID=A0ACC1KD69_9FUNG|nr:hypothetical protein LPJ60_005959 [Coemansia sp. RSA 2675]KAJ2013940.1 hypothetical protein IWW57_005962 [Coemansia sp. S610]KAJ2386122.1 hypothetical protein H4S02_004005 [Coemansia sp. RSA 2611]KAJ2406936.1 hypothetical protein GGI10_005084 [Coemansia sp. RSA 2530]KAJ2693456.1 hypothetical protein H4218_006032 [Coemansia sp. IMI 209128]KAJ2787216.1 hypothetical protein GGI18_003160 [Coemansia linderi]